MTIEEAREILETPGYDAYGSLRIYGIIEGGESHGQITAIKSVYHLEKRDYSEIYTRTNNGYPPIRRA